MPMTGLAYQSELESLQKENSDLRATLRRYSNPWTVEIQNQASKSWVDHCCVAPLTLADAETWAIECKRENPQAKFRVRPWINPAQRRYFKSKN